MSTSITVSVGGMTCGSCVNTVTNALVNLGSGVSADVNLGSGLATVKGPATIVTFEAIKGAVEDVGFTAGLAEPMLTAGSAVQEKDVPVDPTASAVRVACARTALAPVALKTQLALPRRREPAPAATTASVVPHARALAAPAYPRPRTAAPRAEANALQEASAPAERIASVGRAAPAPVALAPVALMRPSALPEAVAPVAMGTASVAPIVLVLAAQALLDRW
eukprot:CAMPEP_0197465294 /NCGR_PEP_ID=MMETSP1175-20131217/64467_1 /TAXON_ID=1003142 /ORGANISM="Triceratium dubium, Strain CCMP147" /LENGTH=221 /DNA_ID=CAMNT_0043001305 /DNA_START=110 /DNA_END=773 /DNA_ORIENTATION=-